MTRTLLVVLLFVVMVPFFVVGFLTSIFWWGLAAGYEHGTELIEKLGR